MRSSFARMALTAGLAGALALAAAPASARMAAPDRLPDTPFVTGDCHEHVLNDPDQRLHGRSLVCLIGRFHGKGMQVAVRATITPGADDMRASIETVRLAAPGQRTMAEVAERRIGQTGQPLVVTTAWTDRADCVHEGRVHWSLRGGDGELGRYHTGWDFNVCAEADATN